MSSEKMGTSSNNSDVQPDKQTKLAKLQARKKELEVLLAAKNEELYKLCVQEVHLTGIVPPEAPLSPEKQAAKKITPEKKYYEEDVKEDVSRKHRHSRHADSRYDDRKHMSHRLSTPSVSGLSTRSATSKQSRRDDALPYNYNDQSPETFSMHSSKTCPSLQFKSDANLAYRQHTVHTEQINKMYYNHGQNDTQNFSRVKETHFSSSHPDITTHYSHMSVSTQQLPQSNTNTMPLLYQYASHLKMQNPHLTGLGQAPPKLSRRNTLQRTQTYHLTSHSDYNSHLDKMNCNTVQSLTTNEPKPYTAPTYHAHRSVAQPQHAVVKRKPSQPTFEPDYNINQYKSSSYANLDNVSLGGQSQASSYSDAKVKEKQWYETSLDSPTNFTSLPKRASQSHSFEGTPLSPSSAGPQSPQTPQTPPYCNDIQLESPKNCTVIEQGKWIPYREVTKPFEMSDFYKYSTKFRQANQNANKNVPNAVMAQGPYQANANIAQEQWINHNH